MFDNTEHCLLLSTGKYYPGDQNLVKMVKFWALWLLP